MATFVLDSFTGRGLSPPFESGGLPSPLAMIVDAYQALALLITHPRLDPRRVAVMGFSRGGGTALYSSLKRFQRLHGPTGAEFGGYLARRLAPGLKLQLERTRIVVESRWGHQR